ESPWMVLETQGMPSLDAMLEGLRLSAAHWPYTVGWIDCLARGAQLGRGILMRGRHATQVEAGSRPAPRSRRVDVPFDGPGWLLNPLFMRWFNQLYAWSHGTALKRRLVSHDTFFYPLDAVGRWNRLYGRRGLLQYQCVLPRAAGPRPIAILLERLAAAGAASFLAVIKDCGPASDALIHDLNATVVEHGGRIYLAKDAVTRAEDFARMMPGLPEWRAVRDRWD